MRKVLVFVLFAPIGVAVALTLTLVQNRYVAGEPDGGARLFWIWVSAALWVVAWMGAAYDALRKRGR
jgi:hypothetical protein